ncbi:hypothetical protein ACJX0J_034789, partial [Zea mays]
CDIYDELVIVAVNNMIFMISQSKKRVLKQYSIEDNEIMQTESHLSLRLNKDDNHRWIGAHLKEWMGKTQQIYHFIVTCQRVLNGSLLVWFYAKTSFMICFDISYSFLFAIVFIILFEASNSMTYVIKNDSKFALATHQYSEERDLEWA